MRCPKCGFISFDHLTSCAKCGKDIADVASELQGTTINVETPIFLSGALAAFAERQETFGDHGMGFDAEEGIDFSMDDEGISEEPIDMSDADGAVDVSFDEPMEDAAISISMEEAQEVVAAEEEEVDFTIEPKVEAKAKVEVTAESDEGDESFEELDFMGTVDDDEGGLEFDLEDFMEDMDDDTSKKSGSDDDIDLHLDDE